MIGRFKVVSSCRHSCRSILLRHGNNANKICGTTTAFRSLASRPPPLPTRFDLPDPTSWNESRIVADGGRWEPKLTKIVATIGPTSEQLPVLQQVVQNGMRIMRLNFSHATKEEVELRTSNLIQCHGKHSLLEDDYRNIQKNLRAILLDTKGPEIRTGTLQNDTSGHETITLEEGQEIILDTNDACRDEGSTTSRLYIDFPYLATSVREGGKVLLDDGAITLTIIQTDAQSNTVVCKIDNTGSLRSRAGVNLPGADTNMLPSMSEKDKADIKYGMTKDIDFVAASFVQNAKGVQEIKDHIQKCAHELGIVSKPLVISKIESLAALENFDDILEESDGIMVARGDLGVELPLQQVTNAQKEMVAACNASGKPVIVATQMLESMAKNPRPTRAEVADVTNAIYDGADCVMLSGETAKGKYPVESVRIMNEIIQSAEGYVVSGGIGSVNNRRFVVPPQDNDDSLWTKQAAIAEAAAATASTIKTNNNHIPVCAIVVLDQHEEGVEVATNHWSTLVSAFRPNVPILVPCPTAKLGRQLMIYRGIHPIVVSLSLLTDSDFCIEMAQSMGFLPPPAVDGEEKNNVIIISSSKHDDSVTMEIKAI